MSDFPTLLQDVQQASLTVPEIDQLIEVLMAKKSKVQAQNARQQEKQFKAEFQTSQKEPFKKNKPPL